MILAWRLVKTRFAARAFDGEGARINGARWNSKGVAATYASSTTSLALLEVLAHVPAVLVFGSYSIVSLEIPESCVEELSAGAIPSDWKVSPPPASTQSIGDNWIAGGSAAVLKVPSAVVDSEFNFLINVAHPDFSKLHSGMPKPFELDTRLLGP
jgi:RES domain-containing protein